MSDHEIPKAIQARLDEEDLDLLKKRINYLEGQVALWQRGWVRGDDEAERLNKEIKARDQQIKELKEDTLILSDLLEEHPDWTEAYKKGQDQMRKKAIEATQDLLTSLGGSLVYAYELAAKLIPSLRQLSP